MLLRRVVNSVVQVRAISDQMTPEKYERIFSVYSLWKRYNFRYGFAENPDHKQVQITRSDRNIEFYHRLSLMEGCPRVVLDRPEGTIRKLKENVKGYMRNAFVRGLGLQEDKEDFLALCNSAFFEVLRAVREEDFAKLAEVTLGGNETLQFHRSAAHKLNKLQKESLDITEDDLLGDNGHIIRLPFLKEEMGPYIHSMDFTNVDVVGKTHPKSGENQGDKVFCRYKVIMGGVYKFDVLRKDLRKDNIWENKIVTPKDYAFKSPRYTLVELDICQEAHNQMPIKLDSNRDLYDFHVYSF
ncbi:unnamed protein product [Caenorhabditis nigoni]